jgi:predicted dehydrogenase
MSISRRRFLRSSAGAAALLGFPNILRSANPNSMVQVAVVGANGQGLSDLTQVGSHAKVKFAGFCDIDTSRIEQAAAKFPAVPHFQDFRDMFDKLGETFDAVEIAVPDHMHAFISLEAMRRGKHVYCQKPLTHTVWEARQMRLQAAKAKVITQMGNQIHSATEYRTAVKLIRDGVLGKIEAVHSWQPNHGNNFTKRTALPPPGPVPATLDWDRWIGTAPMRDYSPGAYHPFNWRDWQDFGSGTMGDFGCHILDPIFTALELGAPRTIKASNDGLNSQTWPYAETVEYIFPGTEFTKGKTLPLTWTDGGRVPDVALAKMPADKKLPGGGSLVIGELGVMVLPHVGMPQLYPQEKFGTFEIKKEQGLNHYHRWVDAILSGTKTTDGFDYAGPLTETVQLGNVATRVPGITLEWDAAACAIKNDAKANALLTKKYRDGWKIDPVS